MKVHEIAAVVGLNSAEVAVELGLEGGQGVALQVVDDERAQEYIASKGAELSLAIEDTPKVARKARFWCKGRSNRLEGDEKTAHDTIIFVDWVFECDTGSAEAKLMRSPEAWARFGVAEVLPEPYRDDSRRVDFIMFLESLIFTGQTSAEGASREGRNQAMSVLFQDMSDELPRQAKNTPRSLARVIANKVSLNVESFGTEG